MNKENIYQRLVSVMKAMGAIGKGGMTSYGEKYAYHRIDDIDDKLRVALIDNGLVAFVSEISDRKLEHFADESRQGKITWYAECIVSIVIVNADCPSEKITITGWGQGLDYSDKATGKAISYAAKAAYLSAFHLRGQPDSELDNIRRSPAPLREDVTHSDDVKVVLDEIASQANLIDLTQYGHSLQKAPLSIRKNPYVLAAYSSRQKLLRLANEQ